MGSTTLQSCRTICDLALPNCPSGYMCMSAGGHSGYCQPKM